MLSGSTKGLYDDPRHLAWVKRGFEAAYPDAAKRLDNEKDPCYKLASCLWLGWMKGVEFAYTQELEQLYRARKIGEKPCGA